MRSVDAAESPLAAQVLAAAGRVATGASARAAALDQAHGFPAEDVEALRAEGLLTAPLPVALGGLGLCDPAAVAILRDVLASVGRGSLSLGRLYEGHVNAVALVLAYADAGLCEACARDLHEGHLSGVWNTEPASGGLILDGTMLAGAKTFASGAGHVTRPLVTARMPDGRTQMLVVRLEPGSRADLSAWRAHGMRATATGTLDFTGLPAPPESFVGSPNDYHREPAFSAGAWRFLAVQLGGIEAVFEAHRDHLAATGRGGDPHQQARLGEAAIAVETAALFVERAAALAVREDAAPDRVVSYVGLARLAVERAGSVVIGLAQRSVGLAGFLEAHPLERSMRDLATYLRQPAPDYALTRAAAWLLDQPGPIHALWRRGGGSAS